MSSKNNKKNPDNRHKTHEPGSTSPVKKPGQNKADSRKETAKQKEASQKKNAVPSDDGKVIPTTVKTIAGQIVEVAPKEPDPDEQDYREDNLELSQLSFRQRYAARKKRREKEMEGMARMQKVEYLLSYFKWPIIFVAGGLLIAVLFIVAIKNANHPVILSSAYVNLPEGVYPGEEILEDYKNYTSPDGQRTGDIGTFKMDIAVHFDLDTYEMQYSNDSNDYSLTQFPILCSSDFYDILITDRKGLEFCSASNMILDPETIISPDTVLALRKYQANAKDSAGTSYFYAYDITDTAFAKQLGYPEQVYLAFPGSGEDNKLHAERFLKYLYGLN